MGTIADPNGPSSSGIRRGGAQRTFAFAVRKRTGDILLSDTAHQVRDRRRRLPDCHRPGWAGGRNVLSVGIRLHRERVGRELEFHMNAWKSIRASARSRPGEDGGGQVAQAQLGLPASVGLLGLVPTPRTAGPPARPPRRGRDRSGTAIFASRWPLSPRTRDTVSGSASA